MSFSLEHGVFMVDGMADGEPRKSGGEGISVCSKHCPLGAHSSNGGIWVHSQGGMPIFFSDQGLLTGGGNVGGEYPCKRVFDLLVRMLRSRDVFTCDEAYKF